MRQETPALPMFEESAPVAVPSSWLGELAADFPFWIRVGKMRML
jgi:hypothetical protein